MMEVPMPWLEADVMDERMAFIVDWQRWENMMAEIEIDRENQLIANPGWISSVQLDNSILMRFGVGVGLPRSQHRR